MFDEQSQFNSTTSGQPGPSSNQQSNIPFSLGKDNVELVIKKSGDGHETAVKNGPSSFCTNVYTPLQLQTNSEVDSKASNRGSQLADGLILKEVSTREAHSLYLSRGPEEQKAIVSPLVKQSSSNQA